MRSYAPRRGRHPRPPAVPASADPTAGMPGVQDGHELGHEAEEENLQKVREAERMELEDTPGASSSSSSPGPDPKWDGARSQKTKPERGARPAQPVKMWDRPDMSEPKQTPNWSAFDIGKV